MLFSNFVIGEGVKKGLIFGAGVVTGVVGYKASTAIYKKTITAKSLDDSTKQNGEEVIGKIEEGLNKSLGNALEQRKEKIIEEIKLRQSISKSDDSNLAITMDEPNIEGPEPIVERDNSADKDELDITKEQPEEQDTKNKPVDNKGGKGVKTNKQQKVKPVSTNLVK